MSGEAKYLEGLDPFFDRVKAVMEKPEFKDNPLLGPYRELAKMYEHPAEVLEGVHVSQEKGRGSLPKPHFPARPAVNASAVTCFDVLLKGSRLRIGNTCPPPNYRHSGSPPASLVVIPPQTKNLENGQTSE